ncbi:MAG TPA: PDZ domain-containing protein [Firmicutes bacterium]|nr:PDZ domain-containing protein [Candidatus Fermentithermobacillaceae bacterium]
MSRSRFMYISALRPFSRVLLALFLVIALFVPAACPALAAATSGNEPQEETTYEFQVPAAEKLFMEILLQVKDLAARVHPTDVTTKAMYEGMLRGLMESLGDPYSEYMTLDEYTKFSTALESTYSGVGIVIQMVDGKVTVMSLVRGGPAEKAGVKPGDIITSVDGVEYTDVNDVANALRGPEGTSVVLFVTRPSTGETLYFGLSRERITPSAVEAEDLGDGVFYIDIDQFDTGVAMTFGAEIERIKGLGAKGLILDLRDNPGGLLDAGVEVARNLVPRGPIVELQGKAGRQIVTSFKDTEPIPVVVLVNERTASASEIVAGAIRDYKVGILVGKQTFGKGSIQQVIPLGEELGAIKLTIAEYFTPSGTAILGTGLAPDIEVGDEAVSAPRLEHTKTLRRGSVGLEVQALQETLIFLGHSLGQADGIFGPRTEQAVRDFLAGKGRTYAGYVGAEEVELLNQAVLAKAAGAPDAAYLKAVEALKERLQTGEWPAAAQRTHEAS